MNELLADIKAKLQSGDYKNEEHIRLSLVARVLQKLDWDIWNPKEVNTEFIVVPNEDKTRVDVALFLRPFAPAVFIEIKDVGQIEGRLAHIERNCVFTQEVWSVGSANGEDWANLGKQNANLN